MSGLPPHAPEDGAGTNTTLHEHVPGHPMGCAVCEAYDEIVRERDALRIALEDVPKQRIIYAPNT